MYAYHLAAGKFFNICVGSSYTNDVIPQFMRSFVLTIHVSSLRTIPWRYRMMVLHINESALHWAGLIVGLELPLHWLFVERKVGVRHRPGHSDQRTCTIVQCLMHPYERTEPIFLAPPHSPVAGAQHGQVRKRWHLRL
jgi:hypothetical protein